MIGRIIAVAAIVAFVVAPPAEAGFWGDLKQSFGTAVDNARREGAESAAQLVTGDSESAEAPAAQPLDSTAEPVADGSKQLSTQSKK